MPRESLLRALRHIWLALEPLNIPMAVMGGLAMATWKHVRATRDIDLLLGAGEDDSERLLEALTAAGIRPKRSPTTIQLGQLELLQLLYEPSGTFMDLQIDVLLARSDYHNKALERRVPTRLPTLDIEVAVLACEDLILHKLLAERVIDLADTAALLRANRQSLDFAYLLKWAGQLRLVPALRQAWQAAWPDEPLPA
jgi:hypothetical protein